MRSTKRWRKRRADLPIAGLDSEQRLRNFPARIFCSVTRDAAQRLLSSRRKHRNLTGAMASRDSAHVEITPEVLLKAYACGIFPMAESADDPALYWIEPERRGILPLESFHVPARLARTVRAGHFTVTCNTAFYAVITGCAQPQHGRQRTWINTRIRNLYRGLHQ